ncbi:MAG: hypothetical protein FWG63_11415 [Defluviitaleaceae bacterium]|nr:hypothetical protein [Defluviitaleaceae bacterium]
MKRIIAISLAFLLAFSVMPAVNANADQAQEGLTYGTWFETAWAMWEGSPGASYTVYVRANRATYWRNNVPITGWLEEFEPVDAPLVRFVDSNRSMWRVDIPGLPQGSYDIEVHRGGSVIHSASGLETWAFPRYGAAFVPSHQLPGPTNFAPYGATGGYLSDGRINPEAVVMYVSHNNWDDFTPENLQLNSDFRQGRPLVVRFLGTVGHFDYVTWDYQTAGAVLPEAALVDGQNIGRMFPIGSEAHHTTFEGIGPDAGLYGWGISTGAGGVGANATGSSNLVFRNFSVDMYLQFGIRIVGGNAVSPQEATSNVWVHNLTLMYGQNLFLYGDDETDRSKARGVIDVEPMVRGYTISYNHFIDVDKTHLVLGGNQNIPVGTTLDNHYGTFHHNWYQGTRERNPRVRHHNVHVFNNLFQDIQGHQFHYRLMDRQTGYAIAAGNNATVWAEGNIFDTVNFPFIRSRHGHARGYYPHLGHNHLFGDGPGFMVTGDNIDATTGNSIGAMHIPATIAEFGYFIPPTGPQEGEVVPSIVGISTQAELNSLMAIIQGLQPNVLDSYTQGDFDPTRDIGIVVDTDVLLVDPPADDQLFGTPGFPALGAQPNQRGWAFAGDFIPTSLGNVWSTSTPQDAAILRSHIESYAGSMPNAAFTPIAPSITSVEVNDLAFTMHAQNSPMPSFRVTTYNNTFTIDWDSNDPTAAYYQIEHNVGGTWRQIAEIRANNGRPNTFVTQDITDLGNLVFNGPSGDYVFLQLTSNGHTILYPREGNLSVANLTRTAPWVLANPGGGTVNFRIRAINDAGASAWNEYSLNYGFQGDMNITQMYTNSLGTRFAINTVGVENGIAPISLSVPRSVARDVMPWPAAHDFTGDITLKAIMGDTVTWGADDGPTTGNGGIGITQIVNGTGYFVIANNPNLPSGTYELVLTLETPNGSLTKPFSFTQ